jgi:hypothetical protein
VIDSEGASRLVGDLQTELVHDFFDGFASGARANVHAKVLYGRSSHHHIEAVFKAFARALARGVREGCTAGEDAAEHEGVAVIALVDYGAGNLTSVKKALSSLGPSYFVPSAPGRMPQRRCGHRARRRPLRRDGAARSAVAAAIATRRAPARRCSASASGCSGCSKAATKRPASRTRRDGGPHRTLEGDAESG